MPGEKVVKVCPDTNGKRGKFPHTITLRYGTLAGRRKLVTVPKLRYPLGPARPVVQCQGTAKPCRRQPCTAALAARHLAFLPRSQGVERSPARAFLWQVVPAASETPASTRRRAAAQGHEHFSYTQRLLVARDTQQPRHNACSMLWAVDKRAPATVRAVEPLARPRKDRCSWQS